MAKHCPTCTCGGYRRKVHAVGTRTIGGTSVTACGSFLVDGNTPVADDPADVTCKACIKHAG